MKVEQQEAALRKLVLELNRNDIVVLRRVLAQVGGHNQDGPRAVTDKFISLVDSRDPTVATDAAALKILDPIGTIIFDE